MTAQQAIDRSALYNEIVHLEFDRETVLELMVACEGDCDSNTEREFWGTTETGSEWRVHVAFEN